MVTHAPVTILPLSARPIFVAVFTVLSATCILCGASAATGGDSPQYTIVPESERISDYQSRYYLAQILSYSDSTLEKAQQQYEILKDAYPDSLSPRKEYIDVLMRRTLYDDALREIDVLFGMNITEPDLVRRKIRLLLITGDRSRAEFMIDSLLTNGHAGGALAEEIINIFLAQGMPDPASTILERLTKLLCPQDPVIHVRIADRYFEEDNIRSAGRHYEYAYKIDSENPVIVRKYGLFLARAGGIVQAHKILEKALSRNPHDAAVSGALARVYLRMGEALSARKIAETALEVDPNNENLLLVLADIETALGHYAIVTAIMDTLLAMDSDDWVRSAVADKMMAFGEFYRAESLVRAELDKDVRLTDYGRKYAEILIGMQRYEEAEEVCHLLAMRHKNPEQAHALLARLRIYEKDYDAALNYLEKIPGIGNNNLEFMQIKAEALSGLGLTDSTIAVYRTMLENYPDRPDIRHRVGRLLLERNEPDLAARNMQAALELNPYSIQYKYDYGKALNHPMDELFSVLQKSDTLSSIQLCDYARAFSGDRRMAMAAELYERCIEKDPDNFHAHIELALVYAGNNEYERALTLLKELRLRFPDHYKIMLWEARITGWARKYDESIRLYEHMRALNSNDPLPAREMARTAMWGKKISTAMSAYGSLVRNPVDEMYRAILDYHADTDKNTDNSRLAADFERHNVKGNAYDGYEYIYTNDLFSSNNRSCIQDSSLLWKTLNLVSEYKLQKRVSLERDAKLFVYENRLLHALDSYRLLLDFEPGNQEALFDVAQLHCRLGRTTCAEKYYRRLLFLDPNHGLAARALELGIKKSGPSTGPEFNYWRERGRGDLSHMSRTGTGYSVLIPVKAFHLIKLTGHRWSEDPGSGHAVLESGGISVNFDVGLKTWMKFQSSWTYKQYSGSGYDDLQSGYVGIFYNMKDYLQTMLMYNRTNELYNITGLKRGIQADVLTIQTDSNINRYISLQGTGKAIRYTDGNAGKYMAVQTAYNATEYPHVIRLAATGEYRDTRHKSIFRFSDQMLDIMHPYWTPQGFYAGRVALEWYHDISKFIFCGSEEHSYSLKLSFGNESMDNAFTVLDGEWRYEFAEKWMMSIRGMMHRSREWDAEYFWGTVQFRL